jgi:hypothetical protein
LQNRVKSVDHRLVQVPDHVSILELQLVLLTTQVEFLDACLFRSTNLEFDLKT